MRKQSFEQFLAANSTLCQTRWITDENGRVIVNEIARFESLHTDLDSIFKRIGISERLDTKKRNTSEKKQRNFYLTEEAISLINHLAGQDFDLLGYEKLT